MQKQQLKTLDKQTVHQLVDNSSVNAITASETSRPCMSLNLEENLSKYVVFFASFSTAFRKRKEVHHMVHVYIYIFTTNCVQQQLCQRQRERENKKKNREEKKDTKVVVLTVNNVIIKSRKHSSLENNSLNIGSKSDLLL